MTQRHGLRAGSPGPERQAGRAVPCCATACPRTVPHDARAQPRGAVMPCEGRSAVAVRPYPGTGHGEQAGGHRGTQSTARHGHSPHHAAGPVPSDPSAAPRALIDPSSPHVVLWALRVPPLPPERADAGWGGGGPQPSMVSLCSAGSKVTARLRVARGQGRPRVPASPRPAPAGPLRSG